MTVRQTVRTTAFKGLPFTGAVAYEDDGVTLIRTADSVTETSSGSGTYDSVFTDATDLMPAGLIKLTILIGTVPFHRWATLTGVDDEIAWAYEIPLGPSTGQNPAITLALGAVAPLTPAVLTGLDEDIVIGDDYTEGSGRRIPIILTDVNGDAVDVTYGINSLASGCTIKVLFHPEGATTVYAAMTGTCSFVAAVGMTPAYLLLSLPRTETAKAIQGAYQMQVEAVWTDGTTVTLASRGIANFVRDIRRRA